MPSYSSPSSSYYGVSSSPTTSTGSSGSSNRNNKRKQVRNACVNCQKACKKCDDQRPCSRCVKYGIEDGCINSQRKERKRKGQDDSGSERSSPVPSYSSRSSSRFESPRKEARRQEAARQTTRGIRPFPKELLKSLQDQVLNEEYDDDDEEEYETAPGTGAEVQHHGHDHSACGGCSVPVITDDFKTLAQLCSELHNIISSQQIKMQPPQYTPSYMLPPAMLPLQQAYQGSVGFGGVGLAHQPIPLASPAMVPQYYFSQPSLTTPVRPIAPSRTPSPTSPQRPTEISSFHRNFLNRTPPDEEMVDAEGLPSPVKTEVPEKTDPIDAGLL